MLDKPADDGEGREGGGELEQVYEPVQCVQEGNKGA